MSRGLKPDAPGVVTGLAYTRRAARSCTSRQFRYPGKGGITLTGQIGNVMKESAQAALSLLRARAEALGIDAEAFKDTDIHVHVPAGAIPRMGPRPALRCSLALASLFTNRRVRSNVGMTGEITLRGLVLPIGGLKEKVSRRCGRVWMP